MLTEHQRTEFEFSGVLKINALLSEQAISCARSAILARFEALGLARDGKWQIEGRPKSKWPDKGYSAKTIGNKLEEVERLLDEPGIRTVVDTLLDHAAIDRQLFKRPQNLVTLPNEGAWFMPHDGWHVDFARLKSGRLAGVQIFILLSEIRQQGGATLVVSGSHRLLNNGHFIRASDVTKQLRKDPFFGALMSAPCLSIADFQSAASSEYATDLSIVELTGSPGDAYFMDMRVLHSASPNVSDQPRMIATHRFLRADALSELPSEMR